MIKFKTNKRDFRSKTVRIYKGGEGQLTGMIS